MKKKWTVRKITVNLTFSEALKLEQHCEKSGRCMSDIVRELIRTLPNTHKDKKPHQLKNQ